MARDEEGEVVADARGRIRGITVEGLAREFVGWHRRHRSDLSWPTAFRCWLDVIGGVHVDVERAIPEEVVALKKRGAV